MGLVTKVVGGVASNGVGGGVMAATAAIAKTDTRQEKLEKEKAKQRAKVEPVVEGDRDCACVPFFSMSIHIASCV